LGVLGEICLQSELFRRLSPSSTGRYGTAYFEAGRWQEWIAEDGDREAYLVKREADCRGRAKNVV
jgi:hypothetical protein